MADLSPFFGDALRRKRQERGWSLRELSRRAGVSFGRLAEIERGRDAHTDRPIAPGYHITVKVAAALGEDPLPWLALAGHRPGPELTEGEWRLVARLRNLPLSVQQDLVAQWEAALDDWTECRVSQTAGVVRISEPS
jgi:transcriptional regulator with XRE-family HTH domain